MKHRQEKIRVALLCLFLLVVPLFSMYFHGRVDRPQTFLESALIQVTAPGQTIAHNGFSSLVAAWKRYVYLVEVQKQNEELRNRLEELKLLASRAKGLEEETERLQRLLQFKERHPKLEMKSAIVIAREMSPFFSVSRLRLDRGTRDSVNANMPVVTSSGVVGRVEKVSGDYCDVMLLTDPRSRIDVQVADKTVSGTLAGTGDGLPVFRFPYHNADIKEGDVLITTGHDQLFPKGLVAGYIAQDAPRQVGAHLECRVEPAVNLPSLQKVFVVLNAVSPDQDFGTDQGKP